MADKCGVNYDPIDSDSDDSTLLNHGVERNAKSLTRKVLLQHRIFLWLTVLNILVFLMSTTMISASLWVKTKNLVLNSELRQVSAYSPIFDLLDLGLTVKTVNGTLFPPNNRPGSIARQMPNDAADSVWDEYELRRVFPISSAQITRLGKDPSTVVKLEDDIWHLGDDAYASALDVFHQLHCLNILRKRAYGTYYNKTHADAEHEGLKEIHMNHCIDILFQAIQCSGNINVGTMHYVETQPFPVVDWSINRQCIDFDRLTEWRKESTIDMNTYLKNMPKPEGVTGLPMPDAYWQMFPEEDPDGSHRKNPAKDTIM